MLGRRLISIVIPNRNGAAVVGECLRAALASEYRHFEIVVVDDCSEDGSLEVIGAFPCRLVRLNRHEGVSKARNAGARASRGELLFFIDNDCLMGPRTLSIAAASYGERKDLVLGGTYTPEPADADFFSAFQSVFVNHFETKAARPDYVAAHAMLVDADLFRSSGGFIEDSVIGVAASVEDVELCHRLRRAGCELALDPGIEVQHVFRFSLRRSLGNAIKKARTWTLYSLDNGDLLADSGAASRELKTNVLAALVQACLLAASVASGSAWPLALAVPLLALNLRVNGRLIAAWSRTRGRSFSALATAYYMTVFAAAVGIGSAAGAAQYLWSVRLLRRVRVCTPRSGTCAPSSRRGDPSTSPSS